MTYFHPWTLRAVDASDEVPHGSGLRKTGETWQEALATWLDGGLLSQESKRYVGNFMAVHRVRPRDDDSDDTGEQYNHHH